MGKINYYENIYLSEDIAADDLVKLKQELMEQPWKANVFLITISTNEYDQLDIYHSKYLMQRFYREHPPYVVGIARKQPDAVALVEKMMQECVTAKGNANLKAYFIGE